MECNIFGNRLNWKNIPSIPSTVPQMDLLQFPLKEEIVKINTINTIEQISKNVVVTFSKQDLFNSALYGQNSVRW